MLSTQDGNSSRAYLFLLGTNRVLSGTKGCSVSSYEQIQIENFAIDNTHK